MSPIDGGTVLVTGASSGIGRELALLLAPRARALILVARRNDRLQALSAEARLRNPKVLMHTFPCDLASRDATDALLTKVAEAGLAVDVLVNNAGIGVYGFFDETEMGRLDEMMALNMVSLTYLTRRLVGDMVSRGRGGVLNVSSGFGLAFFPVFATYAATKHFVTALTEGLRAELRGTGVRATQVCPGPVKTEFHEKLGAGDLDAPSFAYISASHCARVAVQAFDRDRALVVPGLLMKLVMWTTALTPRVLKRWVLSLAGQWLRNRKNRSR